MNDNIYFKVIFNIRKNLPSSKVFYFIYFSIKFLGLILATQNLKGFESKDNKITSVYTILSKFLLFDSSFNIISRKYQLVCIIIFIFIFFFFDIYSFSYFSYEENIYKS